MRAGLRAIDSRRPWLLDSALALLLLLGAVLTTSAPSHVSRPADATMYLLATAASAPFVLRRRAPLPVLLVTSVPVMALIVLGYSTALVGAGLFLAAYTVAAWSSRRATLVAAGYVLTILVSLTVLVPWEMGPAELVTNGAVFAGTFALGRGAASRRQNLVLLRERAELAERARVEEARRAVSDERLRIAQELHDVLGHTLGVIALQAGVGAHVIDVDREEARAALVAVSESSRSALGEVRRIIGTVRHETGDGTYTSPPGLASVKTLADELTVAGLPVEVHVEGEQVDLPPALDLTAYRIVQESLTNVVRHARAGHAWVTIRYRSEAVEVEVEDDGIGPADDGAPHGHGQLGMRERVAVWGGSLHVGARKNGGYRVTARLPYGEGSWR
ncbi:sensor histidine kinase [Actinotalea sp. K2]|uniref:sensor histidine kinase n=1 Tax=Actinotalea sp. K2 TaxID=2939438 RepID=UPI002017F688|nr:sensor histidine kinase [Actinotalea sp. K2]MCL3859676.1 sensor histidine kinase [Actinotalea sp. K2]